MFWDPSVDFDFLEFPDSTKIPASRTFPHTTSGVRNLWIPWRPKRLARLTNGLECGAGPLTGLGSNYSQRWTG